MCIFQISISQSHTKKNIILNLKNAAGHMNGIQQPADMTQSLTGWIKFSLSLSQNGISTGHFTKLKNSKQDKKQ